MVLDQGFDLNKDQEQILHSKNWGFERTLGSDLLTNTGYTGTTDWTNPTNGLAQGVVGRDNYALEFNGTDEYLTRALPQNLLTNGTFETGVNTDNWSTGGTVTFNAVETGMTGNYCCKIENLSGNAWIYKASWLTGGKKYKLVVRYKGTAYLSIGWNGNSAGYGSYPATSQWNTIVRTFTASTSADYFRFLTGNGTMWIDDISIVEDWKLDLNESWELIKHSNNRDFEGNETAVS